LFDKPYYDINYIKKNKNVNNFLYHLIKIIQKCNNKEYDYEFALKLLLHYFWFTKNKKLKIFINKYMNSKKNIFVIIYD